MTPVEGASDAGHEAERLNASTPNAYRAFWLFIGSGWLFTNLAYYTADLPLKFMLKEQVGLTATGVAAFLALSQSSNYVKVLVGVVTDSIPLFGTRRRWYLLFGLAVCGAMWLILGFVPRRYGMLLGTYGFLYCFVMVISTTLGGVMVEGGTRFGAAGRLSAQRIGIFRLATVVGAPVGGLLAKRSFVLTTTIAALLHFALIPVIWAKLREPLVAKPDFHAWDELKRQGGALVRSRTVVAAALLVCLVVAAPGFNTPLLFLQTNTYHFPKEYVGLLGFFQALGGVAAAWLYSVGCRRVRLRSALVASILLHVGATLVYLWYGPSTALAITAFEGLSQTLALLPLYDLAIRATPHGSEALGYALMMSVWNLTTALSDITGSVLFDHFSWPTLVLFNAGTTALVLFAVPFLPRALTDRPEGHPSDCATPERLTA